jgi:hypothetical protein
MSVNGCCEYLAVCKSSAKIYGALGDGINWFDNKKLSFFLVAVDAVVPSPSVLRCLVLRKVRGCVR